MAQPSRSRRDDGRSGGTGPHGRGGGDRHFLPAAVLRASRGSHWCGVNASHAKTSKRSATSNPTARASRYVPTSAKPGLSLQSGPSAIGQVMPRRPDGDSAHDGHPPSRDLLRPCRARPNPSSQRPGPMMPHACAISERPQSRDCRRCHAPVICQIPGMGLRRASMLVAGMAGAARVAAASPCLGIMPL